MTSINLHYTFRYSQPDAYRFSHDSVFLARRVFELEKAHIEQNWQVLDLCAGCGIVGLDFLFHCNKELGVHPQTCDFLEIQNEYEEHFAANCERLGLPNACLNFKKQNYTESLNEKYDLILCNPPYFDPREQQLSPNAFKNRCRFFLDASHDDLLKSISLSLKATGRAYVLTRSPERAASNVQDFGLASKPCDDIRGTPLVCYHLL